MQNALHKSVRSKFKIVKLISVLTNLSGTSFLSCHLPHPPPVDLIHSFGVVLARKKVFGYSNVTFWSQEVSKYDLIEFATSLPTSKERRKRKGGCSIL